MDSTEAQVSGLGRKQTERQRRMVGYRIAPYCVPRT